MSWVFDCHPELLVHQEVLQHLQNMDMECTRARDKNDRMQLRNKCVEFLSEMTSTERNLTIRLEGEGVVLGYDNITSYMNSKQRVVKVNH